MFRIDHPRLILDLPEDDALSAREVYEVARLIEFYDSQIAPDQSYDTYVVSRIERALTVKHTERTSHGTANATFVLVRPNGNLDCGPHAWACLEDGGYPFPFLSEQDLTEYLRERSPRTFLAMRDSLLTIR